MKKVLLILMLIWIILPGLMVQAKEQAAPDGMNWEISVLKKPTPEEEESNRWLRVCMNEIGNYLIDCKSLAVDEKDKNKVHVLVKTQFISPTVLAQLNERYKDKMGADDKVACSEIQMVFQINEKTYAMTETKVFSVKGVLLETVTKEAKYNPVPIKTFADSMYDIAKMVERNQ